MKKILLFIAVLIAAAVAFVMFRNPLGGLVKLSIETIGPKMTQAEVKVDAVEIAAGDGQGSISGLWLGNPKDFKTEYALKADHITLAIEPASVLEEVVVLREVALDAPQIIYEKNEQGSNLEVIQRNIAHYLGNKSQQAEDKTKKLIIHSLTIRQAKVSYNDKLSLDLPDIELHDIGKKSGGATPAQVAKAIVGELSVQILLAIPKAAVQGIGDTVKGWFGQ